MYGDTEKLGTFTYGVEADGRIIINAYTQYGYNRNKISVDYKALGRVFISICEYFPDVKIFAMPKIGAGLAGGDWSVIEDILKDVSEVYNREFRVYIFDTKPENIPSKFDPTKYDVIKEW